MIHETSLVCVYNRNDNFIVYLTSLMVIPILQSTVGTIMKTTFTTVSLKSMNENINREIKD